MCFPQNVFKKAKNQTMKPEFLYLISYQSPCKYSVHDIKHLILASQLSTPLPDFLSALSNKNADKYTWKKYIAPFAITFMYQTRVCITVKGWWQCVWCYSIFVNLSKNGWCDTFFPFVYRQIALIYWIIALIGIDQHWLWQVAP